MSGTVSGLGVGEAATVSASSVAGELKKTVSSNPADGNGDAAYSISDLVPASDYIVSAVATGKPVIYFDGKTYWMRNKQIQVLDDKLGRAFARAGCTILADKPPVEEKPEEVEKKPKTTGTKKKR